MAVNETTLLRRSENIKEPDTSSTIQDRVRYLITRLRKTQQQFASLIGIDGPNLSRILNDRTPFTDAMINRIVVNLGVSKDWLLTGNDVPFPKNVVRDIEIIGDEEMAVTTRREQGTPIYDVDVMAGYEAFSSMFTEDKIIGYIKLPQVNPDNVIVPVTGDSMVPEIPNGSLISIRPLAMGAPIFWGQTYLVFLDDYRMVKVLRKHHDSDKVILHSHNPEYDDMEVNRSSIKALFVVDAILNYKLLA